MTKQEEIYYEMSKKFSNKEITFEELKECYRNTTFETKLVKREKTEDELKEIFFNITKNFSVDENNIFYIDDEDIELFSKEPIIKSKVHNALKLLNETKSNSLDEYNTLIKRDIYDDIWYII